MEYDTLKRNIYGSLVVLCVLLVLTGTGIFLGKWRVHAVAASDQAKFVDQQVPTLLTAGQTYSATITIRNVGTTSWVGSPDPYASYHGNFPDLYTKGGPYHLLALHPTGNTTWGASQLDGIHYTRTGGDPAGTPQDWQFGLKFKAPSTPGTYNFQWVMAKGSVPFGLPTPNLAIKVVLSGCTEGATLGFFESQSSDVLHQTGRAQILGRGWCAAPGQNAPGFLMYGPSVTTFGRGVHQSFFEIGIDDNSSNNDPVATIDVVSSTQGVLASRQLMRKDFRRADLADYNLFMLSYNNPCFSAIQVRVNWYGNSNRAFE